MMATTGGFMTCLPQQLLSEPRFLLQKHQENNGNLGSQHRASLMLESLSPEINFRVNDLLVLSREWGNWMLVNSDGLDHAPHSLRLAPVRSLKVRD